VKWIPRAIGAKVNVATHSPLEFAPMTVNEIHETYGERIKRSLIAYSGVDYLTASAVLLDTLAEVAMVDLATRLDAGGGQRFPVLPFVLSIAFPLADARRAA
jgi:hypothetical protein